MNEIRTGSLHSGIVGVLLLVGLSASAATAQIQWKSGASPKPPARTAAQLEAAVTDLANTSEPRHCVVHFDEPVTPAQRRTLEMAGLTVCGYLGNHSFFAVVRPERVNPATLVAAGNLKNIQRIQRAWKLHPVFNEGRVPIWAIALKEAAELPQAQRDNEAIILPEGDPMVGAYVVFFSDVDLETRAVDTVVRHGATVRSYLHSINGLVIELPFSRIHPLADEDGVQYVEPPLPPMVELNNSNRTRTGADIVQALPYGLNGSGVSVLVYDGGYGYSGHPDFGGRHTVRDSSGLSEHATHVAGTVGGSGAASGGVYRGMAPAVTIESYGFEQEGGLQEGFLYTDPGDIELDYGEAINVYGADISNNSIGTNTAYNGFPCDWEGNYGVTSTVIDSIVRGGISGGVPFRIVWANGNERSSGRCGTTYLTTAPPACAKNHITVGALNSEDDSVTYFTSWGPADDGRMKPDLSAPGCQGNDDGGVTSTANDGGYTTKCGTSMSSPTVCGLAALLLQDYRNQFPGNPDFRNSTLKILLAHTAADIENPGPDYKTGYGSVRIQRAVDFMRSGNFLEAQVDHGGTYSIFVTVSPSDLELKVTLAWDDPPGIPNVSPALVNDLDLQVFSPSLMQAYPWTLDPNNPSIDAVRTQANHVDNIEQVFVANPEPGSWRVDIHGANVPQGPQVFSVCGSPQVVDCSDRGIITLDQTGYACENTATVRVIDCGLNTDDNTIETVGVTVTSDSEPAGETLLLTETTPESAAFLGDIPISTTDDVGILLVADGDTITATYVDADDGQGGTNVTVTDTAVLDCTPPIISNVQSVNVQPHSATVTFDTDEPATGAVRYGQTCSSLTEVVQGVGLQTSHSLNLTGLPDNTIYFYAVDATDQVGNLRTDDNGGTCYSFNTPDVPNYFTEQFANNDLANLSLTFEPDGSTDFYAGCVEPIFALPTDPAGGITLSLADDSYAAVNLTGGATVSLYGTSYGTIYPGSNGYLTFTAGDSDYSETLTDHFDTPRVSALFDDLNPSAGGTVSYKQLADRVAVTWEGVYERGTSNPNTFQIEMFFDGSITISYLTLSVSDGIAGLSAGGGIPPNFYETDLSAMGACGPRPPRAQSASTSTAVDVPVIVTLPATDDGLPVVPGQLTYIVTALPGHGSLTDPGSGPITSAPYSLANNGNQVEYQPDPGYHATDSFEFKANDGGTPPEGGDSNLAVISITVGGPAWDPVAYDVSATTALGIPTNVPLAASDPNGDPLTYVIESLPASGFLSDPQAGAIDTVPYELAGGGSVVTYQPPCGMALSDDFTFSAHDATAGSNIATATVTVTASGPRLVYSFPLDTDPGWATEGQWAFGVPTGGGSHSGDPTSGYSGSNVYGYNLLGDYPNYMPQYFLTTPAIDCSVLS
ncbi:MAG: S8 family serine peptidase, partial [Phycisphaerales bacterium]